MGCDRSVVEGGGYTEVRGDIMREWLRWTARTRAHVAKWLRGRNAQQLRTLPRKHEGSIPETSIRFCFIFVTSPFAYFLTDFGSDLKHPQKQKNTPNHSYTIRTIHAQARDKIQYGAKAGRAGGVHGRRGLWTAGTAWVRFVWFTRWCALQSEPVRRGPGVWGQSPLECGLGWSRIRVVVRRGGRWGGGERMEFMKRMVREVGRPVKAGLDQLAEAYFCTSRSRVQTREKYPGGYTASVFAAISRWFFLFL